MRSRIVLRCAEGGTIGQVAADLGVSRDMVSKWRSRFLRDRLEGLTDEPRPGRPRTITDEQVEAVITATLEQAPPGGDTHWSTRSMARSAGCPSRRSRGSGGRSGSSRTWSQTWKLSTDPQFVEKGPRRGRPVPGPAGERPGPVRRREVADPGAGPHRAEPADAAHHPGADDARLRAQRHHQPVRRVGAVQRLGDRPVLPAAPPPGVPALPQAHRRRRPRRTWTCT